MDRNGDDVEGDDVENEGVRRVGAGMDMERAGAPHFHPLGVQSLQITRRL